MLKPTCFGFGGLVEFIDKFFQAVWVVIRRLSLQPLLTVATIFAVVAACLPRDKMTLTVITVFAIIGGLCVIYALFATAYNVSVYLREEKKKPKNKKIEVDVGELVSKEANQGPQYYRVAQNPRYVMAEYPDRYELYYDDAGEYKFVKVTLKENRREDND